MALISAWRRNANTRDHQELLQQQQARPNADLRVETLKIDPKRMLSQTSATLANPGRLEK